MAHDNDWRYYNDDKISSIYMAVYKKVLETPEAQAFKKTIIDRLEGATVASMEICKHDRYYGNWTPYVKFCIAIPGVVDFVHTGECQPPNLHFGLDLGNFAPSVEEILNLFQTVVCEGRIHMHGLMNMYSVRNGTKGNKNRFVPWFLNSTLKISEVEQAKIEAETRLQREAANLINNPEYNAMYIEARNQIGKQGIIEQLKNLRHLPLEVIKEALNEFLCMDVMDD